MPTTPLPACFILRSTPSTVAGSASMCSPAGLTRERVTSTQGSAAAVLSACRVWQETPWLRTMPRSWASRDHVHGTAHAGGPIGGLHLVHEQDIDVVDADFLAVAVDIGLQAAAVVELLFVRMTTLSRGTVFSASRR